VPQYYECNVMNDDEVDIYMKNSWPDLKHQRHTVLDWPSGRHRRPHKLLALIFTLRRRDSV
jgi:hypothetical protein